MYVSGFTFIRNAIKYDYPIVEAIRSILPLCDEVVVAVGKSEDETLGLIESIDREKIRIIKTQWNETLRSGGQVLAEETNKALDAVSKKADWCFYIQGDEVLHEQYLDEVRNQMLSYKDDKRVEGLLFKYRHFYGSYDYVGDSRLWYRNEVRIIRNNRQIRSYKDAQGFRRQGNKLKVIALDAYIHHYGWVRHPKYQQAKQRSFNKLWHSDEEVKRRVEAVDEFDYSKIDSLKKYTGTHPQVMQKRIAALNWPFTFNPTQKKLTLKERVSRVIEKWTSWRIGEYKNYKVLK